MSGLILPNYAPVYPISKSVKPRQRSAKLPNWGIEQRTTVGQNQTAPEWNIKWMLRPDDADILDAFLADRARQGEWFLWTPPGGTLKRYRCDSWSKLVPSSALREVQATFRQVYSYELPSITVSTGVFSLSGAASLNLGFTLPATTGTFALLGNNNVLSETIPLYLDNGVFSLDGSAAQLRKSSLLEANVANVSYQGNYTIFNFVSLNNEYFDNLSSQIWAWDRDFQVDWWGD